MAVINFMMKCVGWLVWTWTARFKEFERTDYSSALW